MPTAALAGAAADGDGRRHRRRDGHGGLDHDAADVELDRRFYHGASHTLDFEPEPLVCDYRTDLLDWLNRHAAHGAGRPLMRVARVEARLVQLPFRFSFGHALAARSSTTNLIVAVTLDDGAVGYGEGVPREYVTGETPESALARVDRRVRPGADRSRPADRERRPTPFASCATTSTPARRRRPLPGAPSRRP